MGLRHSPVDGERAALRSYLQLCASCRLISVTRTGWHEWTYVLPDAISGAPLGNEAIYYQPDPTINHSFRQSGTLSEWRENVSKYCRGNSLLTFCTTCLSPLRSRIWSVPNPGGVNMTNSLQHREDHDTDSRG